MKTLLIAIFCFLVTTANAQQFTNSVIFCNGSSALVAGQEAGYGFVGSVFHSDTLQGGNGSVTSQSTVDATPLYPNPSTGTFSIVLPHIGSHITASLYDERGSFLLDAAPKMMRTSDGLQFTLNNLATGSYVLIVDDSKSRRAYKISILK